MSFHTAGGWIQAFDQAMTDLISGRTGPIKRCQWTAHVCDDHPDCVIVECNGLRHHVPWREQKPADAAVSLASQAP